MKRNSMPLRDPLAPPETPVIVKRIKPIIIKYNVRMPAILVNKLRQISLYYGKPQSHIIREGIARQINWEIEHGIPAILKDIKDIEIIHEKREQETTNEHKEP